MNNSCKITIPYVQIPGSYVESFDNQKYLVIANTAFPVNNVAWYSVEYDSDQDGLCLIIGSVDGKIMDKVLIKKIDTQFENVDKKYCNCNDSEFGQYILKEGSQYILKEVLRYINNVLYYQHQDFVVLV